jgi:adenylate kinase
MKETVDNNTQHTPTLGETNQCIMFIGGPGSGKGTQAKKLDYLPVSTGDMLRAEVQKDTALGREIATFINHHKLVPNELMNTIINEFISSCLRKNPQQKFLFDGYPRTMIQAQSLDKTLSDNNLKMGTVMYLEVSREEMMRRLASRSLIEHRKDDQDPAGCAKRVDDFFDQTVPILEHYSKIVVTIDGDQPIEVIQGIIASTLALQPA